jgi:exopolysaccharide biosynthesis polyprenyl glycosylphosphotransferase
VHVTSSTSRRRKLYKSIIKRVFDVFFSLFALLFFCPLFLVIALLIKLSDGGPVFYVQERVGLKGRSFKCIKFRTMVVGAERQLDSLKHLNEASGPVFKIKNDPRIIKFGKFLRKTSLDELPQFVNVLKGDMSVVGPRPPLPEEVKKYHLPYYKRLNVKPGITCTWQVSGRHKIPFERWMEMDLEYIAQENLGLDLKLIIKTIIVMFKMSGK